MDFEMFNPARYDNKISERYYNVKRKRRSGGHNNRISKDNKIVSKEIIVEEIITSCWDGETLHRNITRAELMEITGASSNNVSLGLRKETGRYKEWVYSKDIDFSTINLNDYFKIYGDDGNRYYFGCVSDIIFNSTGTRLDKKEIHRLYFKNMICFEGVKVYIN